MTNSQARESTECCLTKLADRRPEARPEAETRPEAPIPKQWMQPGQRPKHWVVLAKHSTWPEAKALSAAWQTRRPEPENPARGQSTECCLTNSQAGARKPGQRPKHWVLLDKLAGRSPKTRPEAKALSAAWQTRRPEPGNPARGQSTECCLTNSQAGARKPGQRPKHWVLLDKLAGRSPKTRPEAKALSAAWQTRRPEPGNPARGQSTECCLTNSQAGARKPGQRPKHWVLLDKLAGRSLETRPEAKALSAAWQTRRPEPGNPARGQSTECCLTNSRAGARKPGQRPKHWVLLDKLAGRSPETRPEAKALSAAWQTRRPEPGNPARGESTECCLTNSQAGARKLGHRPKHWSRGATKERTIVLFAVWACLKHDAMSWCIGDDKQGNVLQHFWSYITFSLVTENEVLTCMQTKTVTCLEVHPQEIPYHPQSHWTPLETSQVRWVESGLIPSVSCLVKHAAVWCCASGFQKPFSVCFKKFARTSSPWWKAGDPTSGKQVLITIIVNQSLLVTIIIIMATIVFIIILDNYHV